MSGRQAKILTDSQIKAVLGYAAKTRYPARNRVIVLLSAKAGLRAGEIANLTWDMVLDPAGSIAGTIELRDWAAKYRGGRIIPLHPQLRTALDKLLHWTNPTGPVIRSERGGPMRPLSIVIWFARAYRAVGLAGCSSHSGRRTFITRAARSVHRAGGSLRDVQMLAGHRSIQTTQRYIDGDSDAQRRLVALV
jgi:integrase